MSKILKRIAASKEVKKEHAPMLKGKELRNTLKRIAKTATDPKERRNKTTLDDVVLQDGKKLKPRAKNKAAVAWLLYHTNNTIDIEDCSQMINGVQKAYKKYKLHDADLGKLITLRTLHATVKYVEEHCGRNFINDMRGDISKYGLSISPSDVC